MYRFKITDFFPSLLYFNFNMVIFLLMCMHFWYQISIKIVSSNLNNKIKLYVFVSPFITGAKVEVEVSTPVSKQMEKTVAQIPRQKILAEFN